jgi:hypothetical protein
MNDNILLQHAEIVKARLVKESGFRDFYSEQFNQLVLQHGDPCINDNSAAALIAFSQVMCQYYASAAAHSVVALQHIFDMCSPSAKPYVMQGLP